MSEIQNVAREYTVEVPQTRIRQVTDTVERPVYHDFVMRTTVAVPHTETRAATRTVSRMVPVQEQKTVCEHTGHWELRSTAAAPYSAGYGGEETVGTRVPACRRRSPPRLPTGPSNAPRAARARPNHSPRMA